MAHKRVYHSACSQLSRYLIVSGTRQSAVSSSTTINFGGNSSASVERYDSLKDSWEELPRLNVGRYRHASCATANSVYVFCGQNRNAEKISSIEVLRTDQEDSVGAEWRLINAPILGERMLPAVSTLNDR